MKAEMLRAWLYTGSAVALASGCTTRHYDVTSKRTGTANGAGATEVRIAAGAGWLRIEGRSGLTQLRASGIAHASSRGLLDQIRLTVTRTGSVVSVVATVPTDVEPVGQAAALDLTIDVPAGLALRVVDNSGETVIRDVGPLSIADYNGGLEIEGVTGDLDVEDGSGDLQVSNVHGHVHIVDGPGAIYVAHVDGSVDIPTDGAGEIQISDVTGSLSIGPKQSGEVAASDVGGNFIVDAKGSGSIEYHGIKGHVSVPVRAK